MHGQLAKSKTRNVRCLVKWTYCMHYQFQLPEMEEINSGINTQSHPMGKKITSEHCISKLVSVTYLHITR